MSVCSLNFTIGFIEFSLYSLRVAGYIHQGDKVPYLPTMPQWRDIPTTKPAIMRAIPAWIDKVHDKDKLEQW